MRVPEQESAELYLSNVQRFCTIVFVYFPILFVRFEELYAFLAPTCMFLAVRALEDCRGIERADFLNSFTFLKYPGITYQPLTSCCRLIPEYFKKRSYQI